MKSVFYWILVLLSVVIFTSCEPDRASAGDLYSAVPKNAAAIVEVGDLHQALNQIGQTEIYTGIDSLPFVLQFAQNLRSLTHNFTQDSLQEFSKNQPMLMVAALSGAEKYSLLFITGSHKKFEKAFSTKLAKDYQVKKKTYSEAEIFHFYKEDKSKNYYVCSFNGLLLFSTNANLLEESIRQTNSEYNIKQDAGFKKLYETANRKDMANIYLNLAELPGLAKKIAPLANAEYLTRMGNWVEMDVSIENNELIMSGLIHLPEAQAWFPQSFTGVAAQKTKGQEVVPVSAGLWISHTFENAEQYYRNYRDYMERAGRLRKHDQLVEKLGFDAHQFLLNWVDTEMGLFGAAGKTEQESYVAYFSFRSEDDTKQALDELASQDYVEGYRGVIIKKMAAENALPRFYGNLFNDFHYPYFTITNGFALFSESLPQLKGVINDILSNKTLSQDKDFNDFNENFPGRAHIKVVASNPGFLPMLANSLEGSDAKIMEKHADKLNNFRWAGLQINVDGNKAFTSFYAKHSIAVKEKVSRQWSTQLESEAANVPQFLKNYVTNRYDIAIQDKDHRLYLLDYNGKVLWTKMLDGPIMGNITQVDLFKNNKLQMALNTPGRLYIIDRLGRDVENFPVELKEPATAPVGVFNYDNARNYRFIIPSGKDLLNYDLTGKPVKGWKFKKTGSAIITKPQHFAVKGKDLIVIETEDGKLYQLNRAGETRFKTIEGLPKLKIPFYLKEGENLALSEMITIADDGKLYSFRPGGADDKLYLDEDHPADEFLFFDTKYIFSSDEKLFVKSDDKPWVGEMDGDISTKPKAMIFRGDFYAGAFSQSAEEIRLYNKFGELIEGFPVFAQGPFDMGSLRANSSINIVTYSEDGTVICYQVN